MRWLAPLLLALAALPLRAEEVVMGLSQDAVSITATFDGSDILIYGAVRREAPIPEQPLDVIIAITGPSETVTVRRKERRFGIWMNVEAATIDVAPSFYAVASTRPLSDALSQTEDLRYRVSLDRAIRTIGATEEAEDVTAFLDALVRVRERDGAYTISDYDVHVAAETLFSTQVSLPADLTEGVYRARILLARNGRVIDLHETDIAVRKVGLERWLFVLAQDHALIYGLGSLVIAVAAGWAASAGFAALRR